MKNKKPEEIQISELLLVKCLDDWKRTYMAVIKRESDFEGNPIVRGQVIIEEGKVWSTGKSSDELGENLDVLCCLKLDFGIHDHSGIKIAVREFEYYLN